MHIISACQRGQLRCSRKVWPSLAMTIICIAIVVGLHIVPSTVDKGRTLTTTTLATSCCTIRGNVLALNLTVTICSTPSSPSQDHAYDNPGPFPGFVSKCLCTRVSHALTGLHIQYKHIHCSHTVPEYRYLYSIVTLYTCTCRHVDI